MGSRIERFGPPLADGERLGKVIEISGCCRIACTKGVHSGMEVDTLGCGFRGYGCLLPSW